MEKNILKKIIYYLRFKLGYIIFNNCCSHLELSLEINYFLELNDNLNSCVLITVTQYLFVPASLPFAIPGNLFSPHQAQTQLAV